MPHSIVENFGGLPSYFALLPESIPSLDNLFDEADNETQALQPQALAVTVAASKTRLEKDHNRPNVSLIDKVNNVNKLMSNVKEKPPPEPQNITFSEEFSKLFPEANEKVVEQEDEIPILTIQDLDQIFSILAKVSLKITTELFLSCTISHENSIFSLTFCPCLFLETVLCF